MIFPRPCPFHSKQYCRSLRSPTTKLQQGMPDIHVHSVFFTNECGSMPLLDCCEHERQPWSCVRMIEIYIP